MLFNTITDFMPETLNYILEKIENPKCLLEEEELYEFRELLYFLDDEELLLLRNELRKLVEVDQSKQYEHDYGRFDWKTTFESDDKCDSIDDDSDHDESSEDFCYWEQYDRLSDEVSNRLCSFKKRKRYINKRVEEILNGINDGTIALSEEVRTELKERWFFQTNVTKRKIVDCYLKSNNIEIINEACWGLRCSSVWSKKYIETIQRLWEIYRTAELAELILKHSSKEYLLEHQVSLGSSPLDYYKLCKRLMHAPGFVIEEERVVNKLVYFHLLKEQGGDISSSRIFEFLFRCLLTVLTEKKRTVGEMRWAHDFYERTSVDSVLDHCYITFKEHGYSYLTTKGFRFVESIIMLFRGLKRLDDIMYYLDWDKKIQTICYDKFNKLKVYSKDSQQQSVELMKKIFIEIVVQEFPEEYSYLLKEFSFKKYVKTGGEAFDFVERTPGLLNMVKEFDLELVKDIP